MKQCDIIQDLLMLHVDGLSSASSDEMIEEHLRSCDECKDTLEKLKQPISVKTFSQKEIDYLIKVKMRLFITRAVGYGFALALLAIVLRVYIIGSVVPWADYQHNFTTIFCEEANTITLTGTLQGRNTAISSARVTSSTRLHGVSITIRSVRSSFIHNNNQFSITIPLTDDLAVECRSDEMIVLFHWLALAPHIMEVRNNEIVFGDFLEYREIGNEIKAMIASSVDTGIPASGYMPQTENFIRITIAHSGKKVIPSYIPQWPTDEFMSQLDFPRTVIYIYEHNGNHYAESPGENIRRLSADDFNRILYYLDQSKALAASWE